MRMRTVTATRAAFLAVALSLLFQSAHSSAEGPYNLKIGPHPSDPLWTGLAVTNSALVDIQLASIMLNGRSDCIFKPVDAMGAGLALQQLVAENEGRPGAVPYAKDWGSLKHWGLVLSNVGFDSGSVMLDAGFIEKLRSKLKFSDEIAFDYQEKITLKSDDRVALLGSCGDITAAVATTNSGEMVVHF